MAIPQYCGTQELQQKKAGGIACTGSIVTCAHIKCSKLKQTLHNITNYK